jgi:hypothetical protein
MADGSHEVGNRVRVRAGRRFWYGYRYYDGMSPIHTIYIFFH